MSQRWRTATWTGLLFAAVCASAAVDNNIRIKVLNSETRSVSLDESGVPKNCDQVNFDAYCHNSKTLQVINTLLVQVGNEAPFRITCAIDTKWSRCLPLPQGESFDAKRDKHGLVVYYADDKGKARKQLYTLVDAEGQSGPVTTAAAVVPQPVPAAVPRQSPPLQASAPPPAVAAREVPAEKAPERLPEKVKCAFSSTPPGAEITLDGKYVGSTPSVIGVGTGTHVVVFSMSGFVEWKRDLTVLPGSELTVGAILQKQ